MPAWKAGIQARRMRPGDIHASLDSSTPCWNDQSRSYLKLTMALRLVFSREDSKFTKKKVNHKGRFQYPNPSWPS